MARGILLTGSPVIARAPLTDLSAVVRDPMVNWPAGYPLVLSCVLRVIGNDAWAAMAIDWFFIAVALLAWFAIMELIRLPVPARFLIWSLWAVGLAPFRHGGPSDWQAMALLSAATAISAFIITRRRAAPGLAALAGALMGLAAITRYAYWPLLPVLPAAMLLVTWLDGKPLWKEALTIGALSALGLALVAGWNRHATGHATYLSLYYGASHHPLYPEHLFRFFPFPAAAFGLDQVAGAFTGREPGEGAGRMAMLVAGAALLLVYARLVARELHRRAVALPSETASRFVNVAGGLVVAGSLLTLSVMSVRYPLDGVGLTAVAVERYWLPTIGFLTVTLIAAGVRAAESAGRLRLAVVLVAVLGALCVADNARNLRRIHAERGWRRDDWALDSIAQFGRTLREVESEGPVVYADISQQPYWGAGLASANGFPVATVCWSERPLSTSAPVKLVVGMSPDPALDCRPKLRALCEKYHARRLTTFRQNKIELYVIDLPTGSYEL